MAIFLPFSMFSQYIKKRSIRDRVVKQRSHELSYFCNMKTGDTTHVLQYRCILLYVIVV